MLRATYGNYTRRRSLSSGSASILYSLSSLARSFCTLLAMTPFVLSVTLVLFSASVDFPKVSRPDIPRSIRNVTGCDEPLWLEAKT